MTFSTRGFSNDARDLIRAYEAEGWTFTLTNRQHAFGRSPDGESTTTIAYQGGGKAARAGLARWKRERDTPVATTLREAHQGFFNSIAGFHPTRVAEIASAIALGWTPTVVPNGAVALERSGHNRILVKKSRDAMNHSEKSSIRERVVKGGDPMLVQVCKSMSFDEWLDYVMDTLDNTVVREKVATLVPVPALPFDEVTEASRRPWLARVSSDPEDNTTDFYESKAVFEVTMSDGSTHYACALEGCDYTAEKPRSVTSHYAAHVRAGQAVAVGGERNVVVQKDVPIPDGHTPILERVVTYNPSERLLKALTDYLMAHGRDFITAEDAATLALQWFHERPDLENAETRTREPMSPEQILDKVRLLVGGRDVALEEEHRALLVERQALADEVASLRSDLETWLSLAPRYPAS